MGKPVPRIAVTAVLLLACVAQAASAVSGGVCPMLAAGSSVQESGCEHCPPAAPEPGVQSALPDCCVLHAARVETPVSEPVRPASPGASVALSPAPVVVAPVAVPLLRAAPGPSRAPAPPPPPRNLPLLS